MSRTLPPLDLHAHVDLDIAPRALESLGAVVFVATRSLDEYAQVSSRTDAVTVWGVGCHPGVAEAQEAYDKSRFANLLETTAYVGEVGLDGSARVPMDRQVEVFSSILAEVSFQPRLISIHSRRATKRTLDLIERSGVEGVILHWWLGSATETQRALQLGCMFSVNRAMDIGFLEAAGVPLTSILPETDHPFGNRRSDEICQPGWTVDIERAIATTYGITPERVRQQFWSTLNRLIDRYGIAGLLPPKVQTMASYARDVERGEG